MHASAVPTLAGCPFFFFVQAPVRLTYAPYGSRTIVFIDLLALRAIGGGGVSFSPLLRAGLRAGLVLRDTDRLRTA